ncbi:MAG: glycosyl transferase, partial [Propionibacterium sp.]|nr:glycosyl transferase [Propionibacterium sp.]
AIAGAIAWQYRRLLPARIGMAVAVSASVVWAVVLLDRAGGSYATLGAAVAVVGTLAALALLVVDRLPTNVARAALIVALVAALAGPTSYSLETASTVHTGSIVTAGPVVSTTGPGGRGAPGARGGFGGSTGQPPAFTRNGTGGPTGTTGTAPSVAQAPTGGFAGGAGGMGGLLDGATVSSTMTSLLESDAAAYTWVAATVGAQNSASYQLATGDPVMAIGGFNGSDPSPTLSEFQQLVARHAIHYFIGGGGFGGQSGGSDDASAIASWVEQNFTAQTVGSITVYDLSRSA